jgi:hypothetical protein
LPKIGHKGAPEVFYHSCHITIKQLEPDTQIARIKQQPVLDSYNIITFIHDITLFYFRA